MELSGVSQSRLADLVVAPSELMAQRFEPMVREIVARYLTLDGISVQEVGDGDEVMAWLAGHRPDLVVLDVMLPEPMVSRSSATSGRLATSR